VSPLLRPILGARTAEVKGKERYHLHIEMEKRRHVDCKWILIASAWLLGLPTVVARSYVFIMSASKHNKQCRKLEHL